MASKEFTFDLIPFEQDEEGNVTANGIVTNADDEQLSVTIPLTRQENKWFNQMIESLRKRTLSIDWERDE